MIEYTDADGKVRRVPGFTDKKATEQKAASLERQVARQQAGMIDLAAAEQHKKPLADHLADFARSLAAKGNTAKHVALTRSRVRAVLDGCGFTGIADLSGSAVHEYLAELPRTGITVRVDQRTNRRPVGIKTSNYYLRDVKAFCRWLVKDRRMPSNPLAHLEPLNPKTDVRKKRRTLEPDDFARFIEAARAGKPFRRISGADRAILYLLAANTGLRENELASLTPASFCLDGTPPTVRVVAGYSKHREEDTLPLRPDVAELIRRFIAAKPAAATLWPGTWTKKGALMVRQDLEAARTAWLDQAGEDEELRIRRAESNRLIYRDDAGFEFDFHALRHQFISNLAAAGVHPKLASELARHSTIRLIMDFYTHVRVSDQSAALDKLPKLPASAADGPRVEAG